MINGSFADLYRLISHLIVLLITPNMVTSFAFQTRLSISVYLSFTPQWKPHHYYLTAFTNTLTASVCIMQPRRLLLQMNGKWELALLNACVRCCLRRWAGGRLALRNTKLARSRSTTPPRRLVSWLVGWSSSRGRRDRELFSNESKSGPSRFKAKDACRARWPSWASFVYTSRSSKGGNDILFGLPWGEQETCLF